MTDEEYLLLYGKTRNQMLADTKAELRKAAKSGDKARVKELFALLKRVFVGDDVFWANEVASNMFVALIMIGIAAILIITVVLSCLGVFEYDSSKLLTHVSVCLAELLIGIVLSFAFKGEKTWLKYIEMLLVCMAVGTAHAIFGYSAELSLTLPIILSTKYLSEKFTKTISVFSGVLLLFTSIYTVYVSVSPDLNTVALMPGTVLEIQTTLNAAVMQESIDMSAYLKNQMLLSFLPNMLQYLLIAWVCVTIAKWGHRTVQEQAAVSKEFARVDTELNMAKDIQTNILPNIFPAFPGRPEIDVYASMTPAREVGGDFYDFFLIDEDHLALVIADVSGKGMPAALFMMIGKALIKNQAMMGDSPAEVLKTVNHQLCDNNESGLFITAWVGILEISTGRLTAASAGHEYPFLKRSGGIYEVIKDRHGFVLGGMDGVRYKEYELNLRPGDCLFVYTDGVTEATDAEQKLFGMDRLKNALNGADYESEEAVLSGVRSAVDSFVGTAPQFDDLTMLGVTYLGTQP